MRILVVSNYYPPHFIGGYELGCSDVVELLRQRRHEILVLTSTHGVPAPSDERAELGIRRQLRLDDGDAPAYRPIRYLREVANRRAFRKALADFRPELIYFWNQTHLPGSLVKLTHRTGIPYFFYISDDAFLHWRTDDLWRRWVFPPSDHPLKAAFKAGVEPLLEALSLTDIHQERYHRHRQFTSRFVQGLAAPRADGELGRVIPWGVEVARFSFHAEPRPRPVRLLYVGQVEPHKGTHTALKAVALLRNRFGMNDIVLDVVGGTSRPEYMRKLQIFVAEERLQAAVTFKGKAERRQLPAIYEQHDILIFASIWDEPFAITPLEAMASGLVVVGTATGGSKEILEDHETAMIFTPDDAAGCAEAIRALVEDPALYATLRERCRRLIEEKYSLSRMVHSIEQHFYEVIRSDFLQ